MRNVVQRELAKLKFDDHACPIYECESQQIQSAATLIADGLGGGVCCLYLAGAEFGRRLSAALVQAGVDVPDELGRGALRLIDDRGQWLRDGRFDASAVIAMLDEAETAALATGFAGLHVVADMAWVLGDLPHSDDLIDFEASLHARVVDSRTTVLCQYDRSRLDAALIHDVLRTHPVASLGDAVCLNPYYEPADLIPAEGGQASNAVKRRRAAWWLTCPRSALQIEAQRQPAQDAAERHLEALQRSEQQYRMLVETIPHMVWMTDADGLAIYFNHRALQCLGVSVEQLHGWGWLSVLHPDDVQRSRQVWEQAVATGMPYCNEYRVRHVDGQYRWYLAQGVPQRGRDGRIEKWIGTWTDIDDRKRHDEQLQQTADLLRAVCDATPDAVYVKDRDGRYLLLNPAGARMAERTVEQVLGRDDSAIFGPEDTRLIFEQDQHVMTGEPETTEEQFTLAGVLRTLVTTKAPFRDRNGQIVGLIGISRDVTDHKRAEQDLLLRDRAIQAITQGILITDPNQPDNPIIYASPGFERLTGYSRTEVIGRNCRFMQGKDTDRNVLSQLHQAVEAGQPFTAEVLNYRKDGSTFWNQLSISPVCDEQGRLIHYIGIQTDVTDRRKLEEQLRQSLKMEAIGQLAGGVAHDFNNLLTIIIQCGEVLLNSPDLSTADQAMVEEIRNAANRSAQLTRQLLAFGRKQMLHAKVLDLSDVVHDTEKMLCRLISENIQLVVTIQPRLHYVLADPGQLQQVLVNLTVNARDAMPDGGKLMIQTENVQIDETYAQTHAGVQPGEYVMLAVTDTGVGMDDAVKRRLFEPFFTTKEAGQGTGLGLPGVHGIVKQSGGHIEVYSELGLGSTFKIYLPRVRQEPAEQTPPKSAAPDSTSNETILMVEDEPTLRNVMRLVLQKAGYAVLAAGNGAEAVKIVEQHEGRLDLLVTDVVMPEMGGRAVAERVTELQPGIKVLYLSGYTADAVIRQGILHDSVNFLQKPFSIAALSRKVRDVLAAQTA